MAVPVDWNKPGRLEDFYPGLPGLELRLARRAGDDAQRRCDLLLPDGRSRSARTLDLRPRHAARRRRPSRCIRRAATAARRRSSMPPRWRGCSRARPTRPRPSRPMKPRGCRATSRIVLQNRSAPPNVIVDTVEQRTGGQALRQARRRHQPGRIADDLRALSEGRRLSCSTGRTCTGVNHGRYVAFAEADIGRRDEAAQCRDGQGEGDGRAAMHLHRRQRRPSAGVRPHGRRLLAVDRHRR